jgi:hypothetical protein
MKIEEFRIRQVEYVFCFRVKPVTWVFASESANLGPRSARHKITVSRDDDAMIDNGITWLLDKRKP